MFVAPAVKLIIAGTRPADITPSKVAAAALVFGSITPTASPAPASEAVGVMLPNTNAAAATLQHHADRLARARKRRELAGKHAGADQKLPITELAADRILDCDTAPALDLCRIDHGLDDRAICRRCAKDQIGHDLVEHRTRRLAARFALQRVVDREAHRLEHGDRDLGEPATADLRAAEAREDRGFETLDAHRHDHR